MKLEASKTPPPPPEAEGDPKVTDCGAPAGIVTGESMYAWNTDEPPEDESLKEK
jgi:hypothetical protein